MRRMLSSSDFSFSSCTKEEVFSGLAAGVDGGVTVITPNRRLSRALSSEFDQAQHRAGLHVWESADILPFTALVERTFQEALYSGQTHDLPLLLTSAQELQLWQSCVAQSKWAELLLAHAQIAAQCQNAWQLQHAWRIAPDAGNGNEDVFAFAAWRRDYQRRCESQRLIDNARLPDIAAALVERGTTLQRHTLIAYAFDVLTPQQRNFLMAYQAAGVEVRLCAAPIKTATCSRVALNSAHEELQRAAQWARARFEANNTARIGIVVPDLEHQRAQVVRVFSRAFAPAWNLPQANGSAKLPFNLSLGSALHAYPLVYAALAMLDVCCGEVDFLVASQVLRSPFIGGAETEMIARTQLDAELREQLPARITLPKLIAAILQSQSSCPTLRAQFNDVFEQVRALPARDTPAQWARHFSALLEALGFPGDRALNSDEFQTRGKFFETLGELAGMERVATNWNCGQARSCLRRLCIDTVFQPETGDTPVQVLGTLESAGMEFDHLWICGLTDEAWPRKPRLHPFIPVALQKQSGMPQAAAETVLALDKRITASWLSAANEVIVSYALRDKDRELVVSPLIADVESMQFEDLHVTDYQSYRDVLFESRALETEPDGVAPAMEHGVARGGTRVLVDQAACPFRAYARHRLAAAPLAIPALGLNAADRGRLLHDLLAHIWKALKTRTALVESTPADIDAVIARATDFALASLRRMRPGIVEGRYAELEHQRLMRLAREWLAIESERGDFEVVATEEKRMLEIGGLQLQGRIDRMDKLASDGEQPAGYVLIDYKTGRISPTQWLGDRPDDPQLPLYAINAHEPIKALAFARVKAGAMGFAGLAHTKGMLPKLKAEASWEELFEAWKQRLSLLADEYLKGDARVLPKRPFTTCQYCGLQPFCRVYERYEDVAADEHDVASGEATE